MKKILSLATTLSLIAAFAGQTAYSQGNKKSAPKQQTKQNTSSNTNKPKTPEKPKELTITDLKGGPGIYTLVNNKIYKNDRKYNATSRYSPSTWSDNVDTLNSLFISDNNVYIAGKKNVNDGDRATLWINGKPQELDTIVSTAQFVYVHNDDIYVVGTRGSGSGRRTVLWKNGNMQELSKPGTFWLYPRIYVFDNEIYISRNSNKEIILWKDGEEKIKIIRTIGPDAFFIQNGDVYTIVYDEYQRSWKLYKNNIIEKEYIFNNKFISKIFFIPNKDKNTDIDIYMLDNNSLWKNNENSFIKITEFESIENPATLEKIPTIPRHVFAMDNDIYVIANCYTSSISKLLLWKNGTTKIIAEPFLVDLKEEATFHIIPPLNYFN